MEVSSAGDAQQPPVVLRYVYPGVTPKNGRVVTVSWARCGGAGGGEGDVSGEDDVAQQQNQNRVVVLTGAEVTAQLARDGVDTTRWALRYYHKAHEGWMRVEPDTRVAFTSPHQMRLELALEPASTTTKPSSPSDGNRRVLAEEERDGYFGIGIYGGKNEANQGTLWRSAWQLGAAFTFTVGARFEKTSSDTTKTWTSLPAYSYTDWGAFVTSQPYCATWVAVEMGGTPLEEFVHPDRAVYVLGSEDNGLPTSVLRACAHHVSLPVAEEGRTTSFNVAVTGSMILYDRLTKRRKKKTFKEGNKTVTSEGDDLPGGRPGVDSAKPSQLMGRARE